MICNRDCFNCKYSDCICDDLDAVDYDESAKRDRVIAKRKQSSYYKNNREKVLAYQREYYRKNKEKMNAYSKEYNKNNAERIKAKKHQYYLDHIEKWQKRYGGGN